jgi:hypothetical protein
MRSHSLGGHPPAHTSKRHRAFGWYRVQPVAIAGSALLGAFNGWLFRYGDLSFAWIMFMFDFVWVLIWSLFLGLWLSYHAHIARGDWRASLHVGFASVFPLTTAYLLLVFAFTWRVPLAYVEVEGVGQVLSRPDFLRHIPVFYTASLIVGTISGPLYARGVPSKQARYARQRSAIRDRENAPDALPQPHTAEATPLVDADVAEQVERG